MEKKYVLIVHFFVSHDYMQLRKKVHKNVLLNTFSTSWSMIVLTSKHLCW